MGGGDAVGPLLPTIWESAGHAVQIEILSNLESSLRHLRALHGPLAAVASAASEFGTAVAWAPLLQALAAVVFFRPG